jgi:hypothetical protein
MRRIATKLLVGIAVAVGSLVTAAGSALAAPANDEIGGATSIAVPSTTEVDVSTATTGADDPADCTGGGSVWYTVTATADETIVIDTFGSDYDTFLGVYTGSPGDLTLVACNDDFQSLQSLVAFNAEAGTTYYVVVSSCCSPEAGAGGNLVLNTSTSEIPALEVGVTVDPIASVRPRTGTVTVSGTVECNLDTTVALDAFLTQRAGRVNVQGAEFDEIECTAPSTTWSFDITGFNGRFVAGRGTLEANAFACGELNCDGAFATSTIKLRRR